MVTTCLPYNQSFTCYATVMHFKIEEDIQVQKINTMEYKWQIVIIFWRPLLNDFKFELDVVCKVILIFTYILRLRKTFRHRKINTMECKWQILHHYSNMTCIQCEFSFRGPLPNVIKFELNIVCKVILVF